MHHVSLCLVALFVLACRGTTEPRSLTIRVEGTVTAADDGSPVVGGEAVAVQFGFVENNILDRDSTDTSGRYSLSFVNTDCIFGDRGRLFVNHPDFFAWGPNFNCTEELQTLDVQLERHRF